jgi:hypothetical protein
MGSMIRYLPLPNRDEDGIIPESRVCWIRRPGDWVYEINFDGYRALALRSGPKPRD